jgi:hypothetical protein
MLKSDHYKIISYLYLRDKLPEEAEELKTKFTQVSSAMYRRQEYKQKGYMNPEYKLNKFDSFDDDELGEAFDNIFKTIFMKYGNG